jgi:hypothetical protein
VAFVRAAQAGERHAVLQALDGGDVSDVNVRVRPLHGKRGSKPVSALHAAAAAGAAEVVESLLDHGASLRVCLEQLRPLTPLHLAATARVAHTLLSAGAQPISLDPREPEPVWYHHQHGRDDVAQTIVAWKRAQTSHERARQQATPTNSTTRGVYSAHARRCSVPAASDAEVRDAVERWQLPACRAAPMVGDADHTDAHAQCGGSADAGCGGGVVRATSRVISKGARRGCAMSHHAMRELACTREAAGEAAGEVAGEAAGEGHGDASFDGSVCSICLTEMEATDKLMSLPCAPAHAAHSHVWHAACLCRWLQHKRSCPVCRHDVLSLLRASDKNACKDEHGAPRKQSKRLATDDGKANLTVAAREGQRELQRYESFQGTRRRPAFPPGYRMPHARAPLPCQDLSVKSV